MNKNKFIISFFLLFFLPIVVSAQTDAELLFEGKDLASPGEEISLELKIQNIKDSRLTLTGGIISVDDTNCFQIINMTALDSSVDFNIENGKFTYMNIGGLQQDTSILKVDLKSSTKSCKTKINIESPKLAFYDKTQIYKPTISKEITSLNAQELTLNVDALKLSIGETYQLEMYVPSGLVISPSLINYSSLSPLIASVDKNGKIKAQKVGETSIIAQYGIKEFQTKVTVVDYLRGDVNGDGVINPLDHYLALRMSLGLNKPNQGELIRGDINNNNRIDPGDVYYILRRSLGLKN